MDRSGRSSVPAQPWHALFAPLPGDVVPRRKPVAPPEILAKPEGAAIAGWEQLTIELSAGCVGLRIAMVVLDASGQPVSASDMVLYRSEPAQGQGAIPPGTIEYSQESVGGRLEPDGTFRGTRWQSVSVETADGREVKRESTPSEPSAADVIGLKELVAEILRRAHPAPNR